MAIIGNNTGGGLLNQGQKTAPTATAKTTATVDVSKTFTSKPKAGSLGVGEVGTYKDSKGKEVYVVGTVNGGLTKGTSSVSSAAKKLNSVIKQAEAAQVTNLAQDNKIEIIELKKTLADQGLTKAQISAAVKEEESANKVELKQAKALLKPTGYQTLNRDATTGLLGFSEWKPTTSTVQNKDGTTTTKTNYTLPVPTSFNTSSVENADGTKGTAWNSLSYKGTGADAVKQNIVSTLEDVNKLKINYGLIGDIYTYKDAGKTQSTTGVSNSALYSALRNGNIVFNEETQNFNLNPDAKKIDNALIKDGGKGFQRIITGVLARDTAIGDKAFVGTDAKGNLRVQRGQDGAFMGGKLVDSGQVDVNKNKIFVHEGGWDTKYNKASYNSIYVQNPDGTFTYMGTPDVGYTHIDKQKGFDLGGFVVQAAIGIIGAKFGVPRLGELIAAKFGIGQGVAEIAAAALLGGGTSAIKGSGLEGILTDAVLAGMGQAVGGIVSEAAKQAGGYTNLIDDMAQNGLSGYVKSASDTVLTGGAATVADDVAKAAVDVATDVPFEGAVFNQNTGTYLNPSYFDDVTGISPGLISQGDMTLQGVQPSVDTAQLDDYLKLNPSYTPPAQVVAPPVDVVDNMNPPFEGAVYNPYTKNWLNPNYYDDVLGQNPILKNVGGATNPDTPTGLLDTLGKSLGGMSPWTLAALGGGAALTPVIVDKIGEALNPEVAPVTKYPDVNLNPEMNNNNMLNMPDWWNNLYSRGGFGAGNYLGYDILRGLNVPADVQSLLGTNSGQNTGSSLIA